MFFETIAKFDTFQFICGTPTGQGGGVVVQCGDGP